MTKSALLSDCGLYRYVLTRIWSAAPPVCWIMLNPSTADANTDDPTIRKCIGFANCLGHGGIIVVNLFAFRCTNPDELPKGNRAIGVDNDEAIMRETDGRRIIAAWGARNTGGRDYQVRTFMRDARRQMESLCLTKKGKPQHPLYVGYDAQPIKFCL
jgi:hypothetical protein